MINLTFITGNANKAAQLSQWLDHPVEHLKLDLDEIQTTDITELVTHKARQAFQKIKKPVLVEDSGLTFSTLGKLPGVFIKFFEEEIGLEKCCRILDSFNDRSAVCNVTFGSTLDGKAVKIFHGEVKGSISIHPQGGGGFGWDPIFIPDGALHTRAELQTEEYKQTSPRQKAILKLKAYLEELS